MSSTVFADDISELIGKKVEGTANVEIALYQSTLQSTKEAVKKIKENIASGKYTGDELTYLQIDLERAQKMIPKDEAKIAELEAQLAELQEQ